MERKVIKRLPTTEVKAHLGQIVHEVLRRVPLLLSNHAGEDQAVIISLGDFHAFWLYHRAVYSRTAARSALRSGPLTAPA